MISDEVAARRDNRLLLRKYKTGDPRVGNRRIYMLLTYIYR
jgi:hypothetical protein